MNRTQSFLVICTICLTQLCAPPRANAFPLQWALGIPSQTGGGFQIGNLRFGDFTYTKSGLMPEAIDIDVELLNLGDFRFTPGFRLHGAFLDDVGGASSSALLTYTVTALQPPFEMFSAKLSANPVDGGGVARVTDTFLPEIQPELLSVTAGANLSDQLDFENGPLRVLHVQRDILLSAGSEPATLSFIDQTFSIALFVPEPDAGLPFVAATLLLPCSRRRRARRRKHGVTLFDENASNLAQFNREPKMRRDEHSICDPDPTDCDLKHFLRRRASAMCRLRQFSMVARREESGSSPNISSS